jgi:hypothetical protein
MANFTPQQLTGGPKYHHKVRIGNWSEDLELEEIKLKDYLKKKETGTLIVTAKQQQLNESLVPTELSSSPEGFLRFGMKTMLANHQSQGCLNVNPFDAVAKAYNAWMATTGSDGNASVRNTFELECADKNATDDVVRFGQTLRLKLNPFAKIGAPAYLHSELVTPMVAAKFSRHQEVVAIAEPAGETKWQIVHPDPAFRSDMEGEPVPAGQQVLIKHVQTGAYLASDKIPYHNVFGPECEVHCHNYATLSKPAILMGEAQGDTEKSQKAVGTPNLWTIVTATHAMAPGDTALDQTGLPAA